MTSPRILMAVIVAICLAASYLARSGPEERIATLVRDGRRAEASREIDAVLAGGQAKAPMLMTLAHLQDALGDPKHATETMELYRLARPDDTVALDWLINRYEGSEDPEGLADALAARLHAKPERETLLRLTALHRYAGRFADERAVLQAYARLRPLDPPQILRLAALLAAEGRDAEAITVLREDDTEATGDAERRRTLLFTLLIQAGHHAEAAERAQTWLARWKKPWLATQFTLRLARNAPTDVAARLARTSAYQYPEGGLYLARTLGEQGSRGVAEAVLADWPWPNTRLTVREVQSFVEVAAIFGRPAHLWEAFARVRAQPAESAAQAAFAEALAGQYGDGAVLGLQPPLAIDLLRERPVFGARIALATGRRPLAQQLLAGVDPGALSVAERSGWSTLLRMAFGPLRAFEILDALRRRGDLPPSLQAAYLGLGAEVGRMGARRSILAEVNQIGRVPQ
jgi:hypothetical protein